MTGPSSRRGFLRGLTTLPLIGGGVVLLGNPTGAAERPSSACVESYIAWLHYEARAVHDAHWPLQKGRMVPLDNAGAYFHFPLDGPDKLDWDKRGREALARAPVVLATVGCDWRKGDRCA